ncbi:sulfatase [Halosimplex amylolyticum]|uniref:sulfatase n=1 Tax=Halosimplex amylolyticum TaxID=3396616 RepID=UPI003F55A4B7
MSDERPNIVLVTVDSLRADHCGFHGYENDTTPTLDAMADDGLVFENAIAPGPATPESMPVIFTGEWPVDRGSEADSKLAARRERINAHMQARQTLPERMRELGYSTAAFTPNPFTSRHFGFDQGFDHFEDFMDESNRGRLYQTVFNGFLEESSVSSMARVFMNFWQREEVFKPWESYYDDMVERANGADEPYFLWVFLMDAHNPYISSSEHRSQSRLSEFHANFEFWRQSHETPFSDEMHEKLVTAYDDSVRYSDAFLKELRAGLPEGTVVAVHGDHGEAFGEHGTYGHEPYLYRENTHVPLVIEGDDLSSKKVSEPVSLRMVPTVLESIATHTKHYQQGVAFTRTKQGSHEAVYGPNGAVLSEPGEESELTFHWEDGNTVLTDAESVRLSKYFERWDSHFEERDQVSRAAQNIVEESQL